MNQATVIILALVAAITGLAAYLEQPVVLLALAFVPSLLQDMPFGLLAQSQLSPQPGFDPDEEDEPQPVGFTQDVKSKRK